VGLWRNIDDKTGEAKAEIRIAKRPAPERPHREAPGQGRQARCRACEECKDDRKDKPIQGLEIIRG
jgi:hypothetical protein